MALANASVRTAKACRERLALQVNGQLRTFTCNRDRHAHGLHTAAEVLEVTSVTDESAERVEVFLRWQAVD